MKQLSASVAAYIAGLIDGEGYIGVTASRTSKSAKGCKRGIAYRCHISVKMCDRRAIYWMHEQTDVGSVTLGKTNNPKHKRAFAWNVWSGEASQLLNQLLPYLLVKREQAENLIAFNSTMRLYGRKGLSDEDWAAREQFWLRSRALNERGVKNAA